MGGWGALLPRKVRLAFPQILTLFAHTRLTLFFHKKSVTLREPTFEKPEHFTDLRWFAGCFALAGVTILYGYWSFLLLKEVSGWCGDEKDVTTNGIDVSEGPEEEERLLLALEGG